MNESHIDQLLNLIKEKESDFLSRTGRQSRANRTTQEKTCFICNSSEHVKKDCKGKCKWCGNTGHRHHDCSQSKFNKNKNKSTSKSRGDKTKKTQDPKKKKTDSKANKVASDSEEEKNSRVDSAEDDDKGSEDKRTHDNRRLM